MSVSLLDVNVLITLFDPEHTHHEIAHDWFAEDHAEGWATCPLTENGFVRVMSDPRRPGNWTARPAELFARLRKFCQSKEHEFWPDALSLTDTAAFDPSFIGTHRQITDIYLLGLAVKHDGRLATFDRRIPLKAVLGAKARHLAVIAPAELE